jgi:hypothetical protein
LVVAPDEFCRELAPLPPFCLLRPLAATLRLEVLRFFVLFVPDAIGSLRANDLRGRKIEAADAER